MNNHHYEGIVDDLFTIFEGFDPMVQSLVTLPHNRLIWKKPSEYHHLTKHNEVVLNHDVALYSFKKDQQYVYLNLGEYGFYTFYFPRKVHDDDALSWINSLQGITTLLKMHKSVNDDQNVFQKLYDTLKELDATKYQQATTAMQFVDEVQKEMKLSVESITMLKKLLHSFTVFYELFKASYISYRGVQTFTKSI